MNELQVHEPIAFVQSDEAPVTRILFDTAHGELLHSPESKGNEADSWSKLNNGPFKKWKWQAATYPGTAFTKEILDECNVLVLAAPTELENLKATEVDAISKFVEQGGSLLVACNDESLLKDHHSRLNTLLQEFGLQALNLPSYPPDEVQKLHPHYISSGVKQVFVQEPAYFEILNTLPYVVATLPWTELPFLVTVEKGFGRVVAIGDHTILSDDYLDYNHQLVINIFQWLTFRNPLDFRVNKLSEKVRYGQKIQFSISLLNKNNQRLERIICELESDANALIEEPIREIRSLPANEETLLQWTIQPKQLGIQSFRLIIDFQRRPKAPLVSESIFFEPIARFSYGVDADIRLIFLNRNREVVRAVEAGSSFEVQPVIEQNGEFHTLPLQLDLDYPQPHLTLETIEQAETKYWRLTAKDEGEWPICLKVGETGQQVSDSIRVLPSAQTKISVIEQDVFEPLMLEVHRQVVKVLPEVTTDEVRQIDFHLYTPEEHVEKLYTAEVSKRLVMAIKAAREETHKFEPLVEQLIRNIAPTYSPIHGCMIPYDPQLAKHLSKEHSLYAETLALNFLNCDARALEQNLAALLLHEKYGHGFFYTHTRLGQQLAILYRNGFSRSMDHKELSPVYPRALQEEYSKAVKMLYESSLIVNEGFAAWIELTMLPRFSGTVREIAYQRKDFLFNRDNGLASLRDKSEYFRRFPPFEPSRYKEGCQYLLLIERYFGDVWGTKCALLALLKAADIDLGIREVEGQIQFGLRPEALEWWLLKNADHDARADMRLRLIHKVLRENRDQIQAEQSQLHPRTHKLSQHPINELIHKKLGW